MSRTVHKDLVPVKLIAKVIIRITEVPCLLYGSQSVDDGTGFSSNYLCVAAYVCDEWEVSRDHVTILKELGQGSFGMVYEGILHAASTGMRDIHVAIKVCP